MQQDMRTISAPLLSFSPNLETCRCSLPSSLPRSLHAPCLSSPQTDTRFSKIQLCCSSSNGRGLGSGKNDSKTILDAFFLGKALAETLSERVEATVGEFLSSIGQWQAEQRKQVEDLQDEVFERAKRAKDRAAIEALEKQGIPPKPSVASAEAESPGIEPPLPPPNEINPPSRPPVPPQPPISPPDTAED